MMYCSQSDRCNKAGASSLIQFLSKLLEKNGALFVAVAVNIVLVFCLRILATSAPCPNPEGNMVVTLEFPSHDSPTQPHKVVPSYSTSFSTVAISLPPASMVTSTAATLHFQFDEAVMLSEAAILASAPAVVGPGDAATPGRGRGAGNTTDFQGKPPIGNISIRAEKLGVVLDISSSMDRVRPACIAQLRQLFPQAVGAGVDGSWMVEGRGVDFQFIVNQQLGKKTHEIGELDKRTGGTWLQEIVGMVVNDKCDAIFWYSDFQDRVDPRMISDLGEFLRNRGVRLYVRSVEKKPTREVLKAVEESGGGADYPR